MPHPTILPGCIYRLPDAAGASLALTNAGSHTCMPTATTPALYAQPLHQHKHAGSLFSQVTATILSKIVPTCLLKQLVHLPSVSTYQATCTWMAPKKSSKTKSAAKNPAKLKDCSRSLLGRLCREGPRHTPCDDFDTIAKVVCFDNLLHGPHCELNLLARGNNCYRVIGGKTLKPGYIYMVHVNYDANDPGSTEEDELTAGTVSSVRYLGTCASLTEKCKKGEFPQKVIEYVRDMPKFNAGTSDSDA